MSRLILWWCCVVVAPLLAGSAAAEGRAVWQAAAEERALYEHFRWQQLGHYQPHRGDRAVSDIHSADFFLAPRGRENPEEELRATIDALFAPPGDAPESHAQCRFPARLLWLREQLPATDSLPAVECAGYADWRGAGSSRIESVSLIAVEGYLRNPSSLYGHVLLRLNETGLSDPGDSPRQHVLATSVNFGVDLPSGESPLGFIIKGLFGGYDAVFTQARFHQNSVLYGDYQQRDLWEYRLNLSPAQTELIVAHTWELLGREFTYYFTGSNCACRTAAVLNLVLPEGDNLDNNVKPWTMPHDTFNHLMRARTGGEPLVDAVLYYPSAYSELVHDWEQLNRPQRQTAGRWLASGDELLLTDSGFSAAAQAQLLDALLSYQAAWPALESSGPAESAWLTLLRLRAELPAGNMITPVASYPPATAVPGGPAPMHAANYPTLLGAAGLWQPARGAGVEARFRLSYYDLLARPVGRPALAELAMLDIRVAGWEDDLQLRQLDLVSATALNLAPTGRRQDQPWSGRLRAGYEVTDLACERCGEWFVEGGPGQALGRPGRFAVYGLLEGRLASGDSGPVALTPRLGWLQHWHPALSTGLEAGYRWSAGGSGSRGEPVSELGVRLGASQRWDMRLEWEHRQASELRIRLGTYW